MARCGLDSHRALEVCVFGIGEGELAIIVVFGFLLFVVLFFIRKKRYLFKRKRIVNKVRATYCDKSYRLFVFGKK